MRKQELRNMGGIKFLNELSIGTLSFSKFKKKVLTETPPG